MNKMSEMVDSRKTDPEKLILAIKKYPAVWNTRCPKYKIKKFKEQAWNKIANEVVPNWRAFRRTDRNITLRSLIKRWNNIRDYYVKSLKARRRKRYAFATQLAFLHPELERKMQFQHMLNQSDDYKIEALDDEDDVETKIEEETEELEVLDEDMLQEDYVTFVDSLEHNFEDSDHSKRQETLRYDDLPDKEEDPDLMFLKSLLPDMKKLSDEEKFTFKYAIMQAYMDLLNKRKS